MPDTRRERGELGRIEHLPRVARQHDRLPVPGLVDDGRDTGAVHVRGGVHVRDEPDDGRVGRAGKRREDGVAGVQLGVGEPDLAQLLDEPTREVELLLGARTRFHPERALRVDPRIAHEPLEDVACQLLRQRARERRSRSQARRGG